MSSAITDNVFFSRYTHLVQNSNIVQAFEQQAAALLKFYSAISEQKALHAYATSKWTLKEILQHLIDTERIFTYRALCIARKETTTLPSYDENTYAHNSSANTRTWASLVAEMDAVRSSTLHLYKAFTVDMLNQTGHFSNATDTVKNLGFIMVGHVYHHLKVVNEKYLQL